MSTRPARLAVGDMRSLAQVVLRHGWRRVLHARERRRARRLRARPDRVLATLRGARTILFVCHANAIRSVLAERWLARVLGEGASLTIRSGGLEAGPGWQAHRHAVSAASRRGLDLSDHRAVGITAETVRWADVIFVMEIAHLVLIRRRFPEAREKTFLLTCLAPEAPLEVRDPWDQAEAVVEACFEQIVAALEPIARAIWPGRGAGGAMASAGFMRAPARGERLKAGIRRTLAGVHHARGGWVSRLRGRVVILTYHRVLSARELEGTFVQPGMYVLDTAFAAQMQFLKEHFAVLSLPELLAAWRRGGLTGDGPYCVVTFDDGWRDNYVYAYPILRRLGVPATVFLATAFVGTDAWFWPDRLGYLLTEAGRRAPARRAGADWADWTVDEAIERWKALPRQDIDRRLEEISRATAVEVPRNPVLLTWAEVAEMSQGDISFGSHSATHPVLTRLEADELTREIDDSLAELQRRPVNRVPVFCYPNGDYSDGVVERVRAAGYQGAVTTDVGWEAAAPRDVFRLRRIGVHQDIAATIPLFTFHLSGLNQVLAGAGRRRRS